MRFFALLPFLGLAVATYGELPTYGDVSSAAPVHEPSAAPAYKEPKHEKGSSSSDCDDDKPAKPTLSPAYPHPKADGTCESYSETCYVTVTASHAPYPSKNATAPTPIAVGTGSPAAPTKAYYSNAANPLAGGAVAIGAGVLGALFL